MLAMLTAPGLTLLFLGVVVGLGISFVWMLWEVEQLSKPKPQVSGQRRNRGRFG
jgi:predicted negative regulator of RcsB-dependent stress response